MDFGPAGGVFEQAVSVSDRTKTAMMPNDRAERSGDNALNIRTEA